MRYTDKPYMLLEKFLYINKGFLSNPAWCKGKLMEILLLAISMEHTHYDGHVLLLVEASEHHLASSSHHISTLGSSVKVFYIIIIIKG